MLGAQSTKNFYGPGGSASVKKLERQAAVAKRTVIPYVLKDLLNGPCISWKIFKKQEDCLNFAKFGQSGLMSFAFEPRDAYNGRLFLSAHPEVFWHYDSQRHPSERCSYEIITESAVCKLYADLEFDIPHNPISNGPKMVEIFIKILCNALKHTWNVSCHREHVLDLDSSTAVKFSRHLIFNLPQFCFVNNFHVGYFLKEVCNDIQTSIALNSTSDLLQGTSIEDLQMLMVKDSKGNEKLFCDLSVYSKNRHFRLYQSTKKGKNAPLVVSADNLHPIKSELQTFLTTLVTYIKGDCKVLEFKNPPERAKNTHFSKNPNVNVEAQPSPYPAVDKFVSKWVTPGRVSSSFYFAASKIIIFNIVGNRFCGNINRQHKSNNVKYVVDLDKCEFYQKCYDFDCSAYRSPPKPLPPEVVFHIEGLDSGESQGTMGIFGLPEEDTAEVIDVLEAVGSTEFSQFSQEKSSASQVNPSFPKFPSFGLSDEAFNDIDY